METWVINRIYTNFIDVLGLDMYLTAFNFRLIAESKLLKVCKYSVGKVFYNNILHEIV